ncbi:M23 family metallopeptidase [Candidatus Riflebacteria bacterium]
MELIKIDVFPKPVFLEKIADTHQYNFEILLYDILEDFTIIAIEACFKDEKGKNILKKYLQSEFLYHYVNVIEDEEVIPYENSLPAGSNVIIYNPFHTFGCRTQFAEMYYNLYLLNEEIGLVELPLAIKPSSFKQKVKLELPFRGAWWNIMGHDFNSHHRQNLMLRNPFRYSMDLVKVNKDGICHRKEGEKNGDYYANAENILSPAAGKIVGVENSIADNRMIGSMNEQHPLGNFVIIKHNPGEYSALFHFKKGSVTVKPGQVVKTGDIIGKCGNSGASGQPHLHYQLQDSAKIDSIQHLPNGLPFVFNNYLSWQGHRKVKKELAIPDNGEIIQSC